MVYTTPEGISAIDLQTFKTRPVVQGRVRAIVVGAKTPRVFYTKEGVLYAADVNTGQSKKLVDIPAGGGISVVNADESLAAGTYMEGNGPQFENLNRTMSKGQAMQIRLHARVPVVLFVIDLRTGQRKDILHSTDWVNHLLFSPTDPNLLMYCHEGLWQELDRIWTIRTDGSANRLIHKRTMAMEIAGHGFWSHDGKTIWYDLQTPKGEDFWVAGYSVDTGERTWYHLQRNEWSIQFNVTQDGPMFCGDGGDAGQVAHAPDGEWIYLFTPTMIKNTGMQNPSFVQPGIFHAERLVNMSKQNYKTEPNVRFTPDKKWVIFHGNMSGQGYVFAVEVARAK